MHAILNTFRLPSGALTVAALFLLSACSGSRQMTAAAGCSDRKAISTGPNSTSPATEFRGTLRDGHFPGYINPANWQQKEPALLWRNKPGEGFSGIAVAAGAAYTLYSNGYDEYVAAYARENGEVLWKQRLGRAIEDPLGGNGPRSTPAIAGDMVYVLGSEGNLVAVCVFDGSVQWQKDLRRDFNGQLPEWGYSESLLLRGDDLYVMAGGGADRLILALNKYTGAVRWQYGSGKVAYSSPVFFGETQIVFLSADRLFALEAESGKFLWEFPWETRGGINAAMPVVVEQNKLLVSSGYGQGAALIEVTPAGDTWQVNELWRKADFQNHFSSTVYADGYLYGFHNGILKCVSIDDGRDMWRQRIYGKGTVILVGDQLLVLSDKGVLALVEATPDRFNELARFKAMVGRCWTAPAYFSGQVFLRNNTEMVCIRLP